HPPERTDPLSPPLSGRWPPRDWGVETRLSPLTSSINSHRFVACCAGGFPGWEPAYDNSINRGDLFRRGRDHGSGRAASFCVLGDKGVGGDSPRVSRGKET